MWSNLRSWVCNIKVGTVSTCSSKVQPILQHILGELDNLGSPISMLYQILPHPHHVVR